MNDFIGGVLRHALAIPLLPTVAKMIFLTGRNSNVGRDGKVAYAFLSIALYSSEAALAALKAF